MPNNIWNKDDSFRFLTFPRQPRKAMLTSKQVFTGFRKFVWHHRAYTCVEAVWIFSANRIRSWVTVVNSWKCGNFYRCKITDCQRLWPFYSLRAPHPLVRFVHKFAALRTRSYIISAPASTLYCYQYWGAEASTFWSEPEPLWRFGSGSTLDKTEEILNDTGTVFSSFVPTLIKVKRQFL